MSYQWDSCLLLLQIILHEDIIQLPEIQRTLLLLLSQFIKTTRFLNKRKDSLVYYGESSKSQGDYIDLYLEQSN